MVLGTEDAHMNSQETVPTLKRAQPGGAPRPTRWDKETITMQTESKQSIVGG